MNADLTGGQALAGQLALQGATQMFAVPGIQLDWAMDALVDHARQISLYVPRHEQATSYMADGFARSTGRTAVCMVVPGPGVLNAMSGLATAYACSSSVVCIAGQIASFGIDRGFGMLHEVRGQSALLQSVTKWSALARRPESIPELIRTAFAEAGFGHTRPAAVEIPPDVLQQRGPISLINEVSPLKPSGPDPFAVQVAAELLDRSQAPVIYVGGGVQASGAHAALRKLAERLDAPVVMSENGRGSISDRHELALPNLGGRALLPHADVVLVVGSRMVTPRAQPTFAQCKARFIYLNIEPADTLEPRTRGIDLLGDARVGLEMLVDNLGARNRSGWGVSACQRVRAWCQRQFEQVAPQMQWLHALRSGMPDDAILINELTQVGYVAPLAFPVYEPRSFITPGYQGTLGYGYPTAIGAAIGNPERLVVSISGDGGFGWNLQELATAARYNVPVVAVIFKDGAFGNVRRIQRETFNREIGSELHNPDFVKLAESFGVAAARVDGPEQLSAELRNAANARRRQPLLLEVPVGDMPSPWHLINRFAAAPCAAPPDPLA